MATSSMDITSFVGKLLEQDDVDALREGVRVLAQAVMETEVSGQIGAAPYERSSERAAYRNGYRTRRWDTRVGTIELKIPKVTAGAYFPSLLEPRRRAEKALSTRKVDDLVRALGIDGISRSEVSRICKVLDEEVRRHCCIGGQSARQTDSGHEISPIRSPPTGAEFGLRRIPVPARGHHSGGPVVPAVRPVVPRCGGALGRAGHRS